MATAAVSAEPSDMECPVCNEHFTEPKILPCAHILCKHCLVSWLQSKPNAQCPTCRCKIAVGEKPASKTPEDIVNALPTDLAMAALVHSAQTLSKDHVCCVHPGVAATSICLNCNDMLCQPCAAGHKKLSMSRGHMVEDLTSLTAECLAASMPATCSTHPDKTCEFFCRTHNTVVCQSCVTLKHRACPEVTELQEKAQEARTVLAELSATLTVQETELEQAISQLEQEMLETEERRTESLREVNEAFDLLEKSIKTHRRRIMELQQRRTSDAKDGVKGKKAVLLEQRGKVMSHRRMVDRVRETVPCKDLFQMSESMQRTLKDLDAGTCVSNNSKTVTVTVKINKLKLSQIQRQLEELEEVFEGQQGFRFHANHGKNIKLSNNQQTAERVQTVEGPDDGIVVSCDCMETDKIYEVVVDVAETYSRMIFGITDEDPAGVTIPSTGSRWKSAATFGYLDGVSTSGKMKQLTTVVGGKKPAYSYTGSRVGVLIDAARCLHMYIDGVDQGVAARNVPQTCYAFFHLTCKFKKATALPLRRP